MSKYGSHLAHPKVQPKLLQGDLLQRKLQKFLNIPFKKESKHDQNRGRDLGRRDLSRLSRFAKGTQVRLYFNVPKSSNYHGKAGKVRIEKSMGLIRRYVEMSDGQCFGENQAHSILFMTDKEYIVYSVMES